MPTGDTLRTEFFILVISVIDPSFQICLEARYAFFVGTQGWNFSVLPRIIKNIAATATPSYSFNVSLSALGAPPTDILIKKVQVVRPWRHGSLY